MTAEHDPHQPQNRSDQPADPKEHPKGSLDPAPVEETTDESGTGSADKRSDQSLAEQQKGGAKDDAGEKAGNLS